MEEIQQQENKIKKREKRKKDKNTNFKCAYKFHIEETEMPN